MLRFPVLALACLLGTAPLRAARTLAREDPLPTPPVERSDELALRAFAALSDKDRSEVVQYFAMEAQKLDTLQARIVRAVITAQDRDAGLWPAETETPYFDPKVHAKGDPIARRRLDAKSKRASELRQRVFESVPEPRLDSAWRYDYGTRGLVRLATYGDPLRMFRNALAGLPPDVDLAQALVERALDDGAQQKELGAFAHAYTDRDGNVYPGVSLYDAWAAGMEIEMPDVDVLGVVHTVLDDWKRWVAPIPAAKHEPLYDLVGEMYHAARRHRGLRHALAASFACGSPILRDGYDESLDNLHALWFEHANDPRSLARVLPDSARWQAFLDAWAKRCRSDTKLYGGALKRHATLDTDARAVRAVLIAALEEFDAFDKLTSGPARTTSSRESKKKP